MYLGYYLMGLGMPLNSGKSHGRLISVKEASPVDSVGDSVLDRVRA